MENRSNARATAGHQEDAHVARGEFEQSGQAGADGGAESGDRAFGAGRSAAGQNGDVGDGFDDRPAQGEFAEVVMKGPGQGVGAVAGGGG